MSNSIGPAFSLSPGQTIGLEISWNSPGWQGTIVWVPQPLEVATISFGSQAVALNPNGTFSFLQNFTNDTNSVIEHYVPMEFDIVELPRLKEAPHESFGD